MVGGALTALGYGLRRVYRTARTVEDIFKHTVEETKHREALATNLAAHIKLEETRDRLIDVQLAELTNNVRDIAREVRPNGGSSIKDVVTKIDSQAADTRGRLAVLEEWKRAETQAK